MLLSSQTDFNYDDQTPSSNPSEEDGSSTRGYRTYVTDVFTGLVDRVGRSRRDKNDDERRNSNEKWSNNERWDNDEGWSNNQRCNDNQNWNDDNYKPLFTRGRFERTPNHHLSRDVLRNMAHTTITILNEGEYFPPGQDGPYDFAMKIRWTDENTRYYGPDAGKGGEILESEFVKINKEGDEAKGEKQDERDEDGNTSSGEGTNDAGSLSETKQGDNQSEKAAATGSEAKNKDGNTSSGEGTNDAGSLSETKQRDNQSEKAAATGSEAKNKPTEIYIGEYSTLAGARKLHLALATDPDSNKKIGVLNFASAKKAGGGFQNGSQAQEESIARASTLYPSLITDVASQFYAHYVKDPGNAYYTHAMVYSPAVLLLRDDHGNWRSPVEVDVLTSAAVNAGEIRSELAREERLRREKVEVEFWKEKAAERKKEAEKAMAERQSLRKKAKIRKEKEEEAKLKKEQANSAKCGDGNEMKTDEGEVTHRGQAKDSKKEETSVEQGKADTEIDTDTDAPEELSPSSHSLSPQTRPLQAPNHDLDSTYDLAVLNAENQIYQTMYDRISRILHLFQLHQTPYLILGSFGTGVFQNRTVLIAGIFADLLVKPDGRFKNVFKKVVFAILGKETMRVFMEVFSQVDKQAQRMCVFEDHDRSDEGEREREDEKRMRLMRWRERRARRNAARAEADADYSPFDASQATAVPYATQLNATSYFPSFDASQTMAPFIATQAAARDMHTFSVPINSTAADEGIPEDEKMILARGEEQVNLVETTTECEDVQMAEIKRHGAQNSRSNAGDDGDIEMQ